MLSNINFLCASIFDCFDILFRVILYDPMAKSVGNGGNGQSPDCHIVRLDMIFVWNCEFNIDVPHSQIA